MRAIFKGTDCLLKRAKWQLILLRPLKTKSNNENDSYSATEIIKPDIKIYNDNFELYDKVVTLNTFGQHKKWRSSLAEHLAPFDNTKILDAAGGTGLTTRAIVDHAVKSKSKRNFSIDLCDKCVGMMNMGQNRIEELNYQELFNFVEGDIHNLPYKNNTFDLAVFTMGFRNAVNINQVFRELFRVVKPGGRVGVMDFCYSKNPTVVERMYNFYLDHISSKIAYLLWNRPEFGHYLAENIRNSPSKDEVVEMLKSVGFQQISTKSYMAGVFYHYIGHKN